MPKKIAGFVAAVVLVLGLSGWYAIYHSQDLQDFVFAQVLKDRVTSPHTDLYDRDALRLVFCGTGSPNPDRNRASACIGVFAGGKFFLVDTGPGGWLNLSNWQIPVGGITGVLFTHYHSDHIGGLGEIMLNTWASGRRAPLDVYGPEGIDKIAHGFSEAFSLDAGYRQAHHGEAYMPASAETLNPVVVNVPTHDDLVTVYDQDGVKVEAFRVSHEPVTPAYGYKVTYKDRSVIFSGDTHKDQNLARFGKGVDVMVHEALNVEMINAIATALENNGDKQRGHILRDTPAYHTTPVEGAELANEAGAALLVYSHMVPPPVDGITERMFLRGVSDVRPDGVVMAWDGLELVLPTGSKEIKRIDLR
ncbi:MAG: MBL fold metallo-hydrolase [Pseudomonadota bacterium]